MSSHLRGNRDLKKQITLNKLRGMRVETKVCSNPVESKDCYESLCVVYCVGSCDQAVLVHSCLRGRRPPTFALSPKKKAWSQACRRVVAIWTGLSSTEKWYTMYPRSALANQWVRHLDMHEFLTLTLTLFLFPFTAISHCHPRNCDMGEISQNAGKFIILALKKEHNFNCLMSQSFNESSKIWQFWKIVMSTRSVLQV